MSGKTIVSYTLNDLKALVARDGDRSDWARVDAMTEEELEAAVASDPDWAGPTGGWIAPSADRPVVVVERPVFDWFRQQGDDYEARINDVLRAYAREHSAA